MDSLVLVVARFAQGDRLERLEGELVRRGAREAHRLDADRIVLTVAAATRLEGLRDCVELLQKSGVTPLETSLAR